MSPYGPGLMVATEDGTATVTIGNAGRRNAMTLGMWRVLPAVLAGLAADPGVRLLVLTGEGGDFSSGADISDLADPGSRAQVQAAAVAAEEALAAFPKPTLAVVRGFCVGGGCQLAVACDLRFAARGARVGVPPARLGIVYPASSTRRLVEVAGPSTAKYLLFSAEPIDAERALRVGLLDELLDDAELDGRVQEFARVLATRSRLTQAAAKEFASAVPVSAARAAFWSAHAAALAESDEGVAAYLARRPPRFPWAP